MATRKPGHRADGTFDGTAPPRNGGRRPLPWFLFASHGDESWAMTIACATGSVPVGFEGNAAIVDMAKNADHELRLRAAQVLQDRMHGKVKDEVDVSSSTREIKEIRISVIEAPKVGVIDVTPVKALRDAE